MKFIKYIFSALIIAAITMANVGTSQAADSTIPAKVVRIKGSARYSTDNTNWHPVELKQVIQPGTIIQTGEGSMIDIILGDGDVDPNPQPMGSSMNYDPHPDQNLVRIWENTTIGIDKLSQMQMGSEVMTDTQLDLRAGSIFGTVKKQSPTSKYEVKVPNGVAGIRGTIYSISAFGVVAVLQGTVVVAYMDASGTPQTKQVGKGYEFDIRTGEIKPLSQLHLRDLVRVAFEARIFINTTTTIQVDHTIETVSPVVGGGSPAPPAP